MLSSTQNKSHFNINLQVLLLLVKQLAYFDKKTETVTRQKYFKSILKDNLKIICCEKAIISKVPEQNAGV